MFMLDRGDMGLRNSYARAAQFPPITPLRNRAAQGAGGGRTQIRNCAEPRINCAEPRRKSGVLSIGLRLRPKDDAVTLMARGGLDLLHSQHTLAQQLLEKACRNDLSISRRTIGKARDR
jgi:hypothetical protein